MSEKICGVYQILNTVNGDCYIGSSVNIKVRWSQHKTSLTKSKNGSLKLQHAWDKYGKNSFKFNILEIVTEYKGELYKREQYYIDVFDSVDNGYNICIAAGSRAGTTCSEETKAKMSIAQKGKVTSAETRKNISKALSGFKHSENTIENKRINSIGSKNGFYGKKHSEETLKRMSDAKLGKKASKETREKLSKARRGENHHYYGKHRDKETKEKISKAKTGSKHTEETKAKMSESHKRENLSEETLKKMSEAMSGKNNPNYGKTPSNETRAKMSASTSGEKHPMYGKHPSEETRRKLSEASKLREERKRLAKATT